MEIAMKELDVCKQMIVVNDDNSPTNLEAELIGKVDNPSSVSIHRYCFKMTSKKSGEQFFLITSKYGEGWISRLKIINAPEKPSFSWDRPIRHIETGDRCVAVYDSKEHDEDLMEKLCVFRNAKGQCLPGYFSLDGLSDLYQHECELENYEPEEKFDLEECNNGQHLAMQFWKRLPKQHEG